MTKNRMIPYGYRYDKGRVVIDQKEQCIVRKVCSAYLHGESLQQIAFTLTKQGVEYFCDTVSWSKSKIKKIIDDDRYLGDDNFPQLIDPETAAELRKIKATRNTQAEVDRHSGIYLLRIPVFCHECGAVMQRLCDKRISNSRRWMCRYCGEAARITDADLMASITELLNSIITDPKLIQEHTDQISEITTEQMRVENEIARELEGYEIDKKALTEKLFRQLSMEYQRISDEPYTVYIIKNTLARHGIIKEFDAELVNMVTRQIKLSKEGTVSLVLINDQEIRKEIPENAGRK